MPRVINVCECSRVVHPKRWGLGYRTCLVCGELEARKETHCVVPMGKSNYIVVTDKETLKQLNPKRIN